MKGLFYESIKPYTKRKWWMAVAYYDWLRDKQVNVMFPFHYLVMLVWWANLQWCKYAGKPSWIDRQVIAACGKKKAEPYQEDKK